MNLGHLSTNYFTAWGLCVLDKCSIKQSLFTECRNSTEVLKMMLSLMSLESAVKGETTLVRVSTPKGHQVTVSVSPNQSKGSEASSRDQSELSSHKTGYILTLQSEDLLTLVLLRSGFIERLSVVSDTF